MIGQSLGVYQIVAKLGEGGMGEVYRARDTRLARDVAIKVLPQAFAADPERLARFEREARTLAALNHPNIAHVHGITDSPIALVMELVDGEDLSARIARGPLPIEDAVAIARQLVDALEAAHDQGIVHRDLKPANIKIRADGTVKVLDFGLARSTATVAEADSAAMHSPTFTSPAMTQFGMILGTAAYMAPEQARGRPADRRVDIWAFGCVLYEMLTGTSPFGGEDVSLVLATILKEDADFTRLPPATPAGLRRLFRRCLEKDPKRRLSAIADARFDLDDPGTEPLPSVAPSRKSLAWPWIAAALVVGVGISWLVFGRARGVESRPAIDGMMRQVTEMPGAESEPHISPDGRQIVFSSNAGGHWDVYLLRVGGSRAINLTADSPADDRQPAFSPDGQQIAFRSERGGGGIFVMGATGESVRRVTAAGFDPAWSPDGRSLVYSTEPVDNPYERNIQAEIWVAEIASGKTRRLTTTDGIQPTWSPDGRHIAYWTNKAGQRDIVTVAADGGTPTDVTNDAATDWSPEWSPDSRWLYFSSDRGGQMNLWRVPMNTAGRPAGPPEAITRSLTGVGHARVSRDGSKLSLLSYTRTYDLSVGPFDAARGGAGVATSTIRSPSLGWCSPSPRGDWLVCTARGRQEDLVLLRADGGETARLMDDLAKDRNATWSPDGNRIGFMSTRSGRWELWSVGRDGSDLRQITDLNAEVYEVVWSADSRRAMSAATGMRPYGTWLFDPSALATRQSATFVAAERESDRLGVEAWSPDGRRVAGAFIDSSGGPVGIGVWNLDTKATRRYDIPVDKGQDYRQIAGWLPDSRRFVATTPTGLVLVDAESGKTTPLDAPKGGTRYRLNQDATRLMIEREILDGDIWLLDIGGT